MERFPNHNTPEELWNWDDTERRIRAHYDVAEQAFNNPSVANHDRAHVFEDRAFFGRALDELRDMRVQLKTWDEVDIFFRKPLKLSSNVLLQVRRLNNAILNNNSNFGCNSMSNFFKKITHRAITVYKYAHSLHSCT